MTPATALAHGFTSTAMLVMAIGAQNAFVLRQGLRREHVLPVVLVCALSDAVLLQVGVWGMGGVLLARPEWAQAMRWAGALFLLAYAARTAARALRPGQLLVATTGPGTSLRATLATVGALTWLNPHVYRKPWCYWAPWPPRTRRGGVRCSPRAAPWRARCGSWGWGWGRAGWRRCLPRRGPGACWTR